MFRAGNTSPGAGENRTEYRNRPVSRGTNFRATRSGDRAPSTTSSEATAWVPLSISRRTGDGSLSTALTWTLTRTGAPFTAKGGATTLRIATSVGSFWLPIAAQYTGTCLRDSSCWSASADRPPRSRPSLKSTSAAKGKSLSSFRSRSSPPTMSVRPGLTSSPFASSSSSGPPSSASSREVRRYWFGARDANEGLARVSFSLRRSSLVRSRIAVAVLLSASLPWVRVARSRAACSS